MMTDVADVGARIQAALDSAVLAEFRELLDPHGRWGAPDDPAPSCSNREQLLAWYRRGREQGVRAWVTEVVTHDDKILVGMHVTARRDEPDAEGSDRWQVLTVRNGKIVDIRGFEDRVQAADRLTHRS